MNKNSVREEMLQASILDDGALTGVSGGCHTDPTSPSHCPICGGTQGIIIGEKSEEIYYMDHYSNYCKVHFSNCTHKGCGSAAGQSEWTFAFIDHKKEAWVYKQGFKKENPYANPGWERYK